MFVVQYSSMLLLMLRLSSRYVALFLVISRPESDYLWHDSHESISTYWWILLPYTNLDINDDRPTSRNMVDRADMRRPATELINYCNAAAAAAAAAAVIVDNQEDGQVMNDWSFCPPNEGNTKSSLAMCSANPTPTGPSSLQRRLTRPCRRTIRIYRRHSTRTRGPRWMRLLKKHYCVNGWWIVQQLARYFDEKYRALKE